MNNEKIIEYGVTADSEVWFTNFKKVWHIKINPNMLPEQSKINKVKVVLTGQFGDEITLKDVLVEYDSSVKEPYIWYTYENKNYSMEGEYNS